MQSRLWLLPSKKNEKLIGGIVARYQEIFSIHIYAVKVLSNHLHMIIRAPNGNSDEFCENVNREIARRLNWKYHREGKFWGRRYDDQKVLSEEDLLECFLYVTCNAVGHGLVSHPREWTGLCSYEQSLSGKVRSYSFHHYSASDSQEKVSRHSLTISPLPHVQALSPAERRERLASLVSQRAQELVLERKSTGHGILGIGEVLRQLPGSLPQSTSRSPRPQGYSQCPEKIREYRRICSDRRSLYVEASRRFRLGDMAVTFPLHSFHPPLHRKPRLIPFQALDETYLKKVA